MFPQTWTKLFQSKISQYIAAASLLISYLHPRPGLPSVPFSKVKIKLQSVKHVFSVGTGSYMAFFSGFSFNFLCALLTSPGAASYSSHLILLYSDSNIRWTEQVQKLHSIQSRSPTFRFCFSKVLCEISKLIRILSSMNVSSLLSTQSYFNTYSHIPPSMEMAAFILNLRTRHAVIKKDLQSWKRKHSRQQNEQVWQQANENERTPCSYALISLKTNTSPVCSLPSGMKI